VSFARAAAAAAALSALAGGPGPALADPSPREAARARFDRGQTLYNLGKLDEAIVELEAAYELDPDPAYLFNLAQAHRLRGHLERALFFYRRYLSLSPDAPNRAEIQERIAALEAEHRAAAAERASLERAAAEKARAEIAAEYAAKRHRVGIEVGWAQIYFDGLEDPPPQLVQGATYAYRLAAVGRATLEVGATYHESTIPYTSPTKGAVSASYSQVVATATLTRPIAWRIAGRAVAGLGASTLRNLKQGNPVIEGGAGSDPQGMLCARADFTVLLRLHPLFDVTYTLGAISFAPRSPDLTPALKSIVSLEGFHVGLHVRL
jgi:tetratricopeptide (TPR) repeat protein